MSRIECRSTCTQCGQVARFVLALYELPLPRRYPAHCYCCAAKGRRSVQWHRFEWSDYDPRIDNGTADKPD